MKKCNLRTQPTAFVEAVVRLIEKHYLSDAALNRLRQAIRKQETQAQPDRDLDAGTIYSKLAGHVEAKSNRSFNLRAFR